ncbi:MAG: CFI-box-CTERM domain-containing protein [Bacteroidia bacterium]
MFNLFNATPTELDSKLNDLSSKIQQAQPSPFGGPTKSDWDSIFELCKTIANDFKNVRYPTKSEGESAWQKFVRLRNQAYDTRKNQSQNRSEKHFDELMSRLKSADYDKFADVIFGEILSFGILKTKADEMRSAGQELRKIGEHFISVKYEMTKEHSARVMERMVEVREHHNDFWGKYNSYQVEKDKAYKEKQRAWEERKKENERKQKEWEAKKIERERKQKEWEARKIERERKQREWEARKIEQERKQREWEARKIERERKQREWEARQAEYQREKERKQYEWEQRRAENERKKREYEERKANRGSGGRKKGGGGCYITTATCQTLGKPDDCDELNAIRSFRDNWLFYQKLGPEIIERYYEIAPKIVSSIEINQCSADIYQDIWTNHLSTFFYQIQQKKEGAALKTYLKMVNELESKYLI